MNEVALSNDLNVKKKRKSITKEKEILLDLFGRCEICGYDYKPSLQIHHIIPLSNNGSNDIDNLALLCPNCHALVHSLMSDSARKIMSNDEIDLWIKKTFNATQKDKLFYYALRLLRNGEQS